MHTISMLNYLCSGLLTTGLNLEGFYLYAQELVLNGNIYFFQCCKDMKFRIHFIFYHHNEPKKFTVIGAGLKS